MASATASLSRRTACEPPKTSITGTSGGQAQPGPAGRLVDAVEAADRCAR